MTFSICIRKKHYLWLHHCLLRNDTSVKGAALWAGCLDSFSNPDLQAGVSRCRAPHQGIGWVIWSLWEIEEKAVRARRWEEEVRQQALGRDDQGRAPRGWLSSRRQESLSFLSSYCGISQRNSSLVWRSLPLKMLCMSDFCSIFYLLICIVL